MTEQIPMGESRGGEGRERSERADQGQAAQPLVFTLHSPFQIANDAFALDVEDQYGNRKTLHLDLAGGVPSLTDTMEDVQFGELPY